MPITRRNLLAVVPGLFLAAEAAGAEQKPEGKPPLPAQLVKDFVIAGHGDLDKVKSMLAAEPGLLNATWDWKAGDFESAIGGAGHMGRRDIALYLIDMGARYDMFVAAMLGELDLVQSMIKAHPGLKDSKGPHGISLIRHAEKGGKEAEKVLEFLKSL